MLASAPPRPAVLTLPRVPVLLHFGLRAVAHGVELPVRFRGHLLRRACRAQKGSQEVRRSLCSSSGRSCFCIGTTDFPCRHRFTRLQTEVISLFLARTSALCFVLCYRPEFGLLHKKCFVAAHASPSIWPDFTHRTSITLARRKSTTKRKLHRRFAGLLLKQTQLAIAPTRNRRSREVRASASTTVYNQQPGRSSATR